MLFLPPRGSRYLIIVGNLGLKNISIMAFGTSFQNNGLSEPSGKFHKFGFIVVSRGKLQSAQGQVTNSQVACQTGSQKHQNG